MKINSTANTCLFLIGLAQILIVCHIRMAFLPLYAVNIGIIASLVMIFCSRKWLAISATCMFFAILSGQKYMSDTFLPIMPDITLMLHNEYIAWMIVSAITALVSIKES